MCSGALAMTFTWFAWWFFCRDFLCRRAEHSYGSIGFTVYLNDRGRVSIVPPDSQLCCSLPSIWTLDHYDIAPSSQFQSFPGRKRCPVCFYFSAVRSLKTKGRKQVKFQGSIISKPPVTSNDNEISNTFFFLTLLLTSARIVAFPHFAVSEKLERVAHPRILTEYCFCKIIMFALFTATKDSVVPCWEQN
jgi:hypothetical protein